MFAPGESGNPSGRVPGSGKYQRLQAAIAARLNPDDLLAVTTAVFDAAKHGDMTAAKLILDRLWPTLRPVDAPVLVPVPEEATIPEQARAIVAAALDGCRRIWRRRCSTPWRAWRT